MKTRADFRFFWCIVPVFLFQAALTTPLLSQQSDAPHTWSMEHQEQALKAIKNKRRRKAITYDLSLRSTNVDWLDKRIKEVSVLYRFMDSPPLTRAGLRRRMEKDQERFKDLLRSEGYYASSVKASLVKGTRFDSNRLADSNRPADSNRSDTTAKEPGTAVRGKISFLVETGKRFSLKDYNLVLVEHDTLGQSKEFLARALSEVIREHHKPGEPAQARVIEETEQALLLYLANKGYPYAKLTNREIIVDHADLSLSTRVSLAPGVLVTYGSFDFRGAEGIDTDFLRKKMALEEGKTYSEEELEQAKKKLFNTGLFTNVSIKIPDRPKPYGLVPLEITLKKRARHELGASFTANLDRGPGASLKFQDRNLFGRGEQFTSTLFVTSETIEGYVSLEWPDFLDKEWSLYGSTSVRRIGWTENRYTDFGVAVSLRWHDEKRTLATEGGLAAEYLYDVEDETRNRLLLTAPFLLKIDQSDDLLYPTSGYRIQAEVGPTIDIKNPDTVFLKSKVKGSYYKKLPVPVVQDLTLDAWGTLGAIVGQDLSAIPSSRRFFLGGPGSIRALAGQYSTSERVSSGVALLEGGVELHTRINSRFGASVFVEGGAVLPDYDFSSQSGLDWRMGAGVGLSYFTTIGPVRVDVAVPLFEDADWGDVKVLVGLGKAF